MKKILPIIISVSAIIIFVIMWMLTKKEEPVQTLTVSSFEECVAANYPVMETYPRQCKTPEGKNFVEIITQKFTYSNSNAEMIVIDSPLPDTVVTKDLVITGKARGQWFFEASFPIQVLDKDGTIIATGIGEAKGDWMTTEFVPFTATIKVPDSYTGTLTIVLNKDNPSDMRENDASISFSVKKKAAAQASTTIQLYYYNESKDQGVGGAQCSKAGLVPVTRSIPRTITPLQDAIKVLLLGKITVEEKAAGITSEFPLEGVTLSAASLVNGTLTLTFLDTKGKMSGGSCRTVILRNQIEVTAMQFKEVKSVTFMPEELFQP